MSQDVLFLRETFLLEELEKLSSPRSIYKKAGLFETLGLPSVGNWIKEFSEEYFKDSSEVPGGYFTSLLNIMAPAVLFRVNPFLATLYGIFSTFGFSLSDMVIKIANYLKPKISQGEPVTPQEVNSAAAAALGSTGDVSQVSDGFFTSIAQDGSLTQYVFESLIKEAAYLKEINEVTPQRIKTADLFDLLDPDQERSIKRKREEYGKLQTPFLKGEKGASALRRIFGNLFNRPDGKTRLRWYGVGFAVWILKTALAGAGLLAVGSLVKKMLGVKKVKVPYENGESSTETESKEDKTEKETKPQETKQESEKQQSASQSSSGKVWVVPLVGDGTIEDTIRIWVLDLYPELNQYPNINSVILNSQKFNSLISELASDYTRIGKKYLEMPSGYTSRKQVIDQIIDDIRRKINVP